MAYDYGHMKNTMFVAGIACLIALSAPGAEPPSQQPVLKVVVKFDSPQQPADSSERLPRTIWRSVPNKSRVEGVVSAETGHRILVVTDSPHLWFADLDAATGFHTVDSGPDIGSNLPVFPVPIPELEDLQFGAEAAYFTSHSAKSLGLVKMNGVSCERQDLETKDYLLLGCFEPMTARPVAVALRIGKTIYAFNYLEYERNAKAPVGAFAKPPGIRFTEKPHEETTHVAH
jgi:hypothetical protein